ncbi:MAG: Na(+)/glucose symporter [Verrucomicrobiota bacterium]|jgi:Na+/proline symporter
MTTTDYFGTTDYVFMGLYVLVLIFLGFYLKRLASRSLDNYICGGKNIPWWAMGVSGMASFLDLAGTAVIVSFLFMMGPKGLFVEFRGGAVLVLPFMMLWTGKWHRRSGCLTGAEWNIYRFGDCWGGRASQLMGVIATVLTTIGMLAYLIIGAGIFLSTFLPFSPEACSLALLVMATLYTMMSGFYGVIFTDLFQVLIILVAVIYISVKAFTGVADVDEISQIAMKVTGSPDWINGAPQWNVHVPEGYEVYKHLLIFASFYLVRTIVAGLGTGADPRYFGAKNDRECGKLSMLWTVLMTVRWPMMIGIAVMGLYLVNDLLPEQTKLKEAAALVHEAHPGTTKPQWGTLVSSITNAPEKQDPALVGSLKSLLGEDKWAEKMNLLSYEGTVNPEKILSAVLMMSVAEGMRGVLVIALIAAALSTFGSWVNLATGQFVNDFYRKWIRPQAQTRELIFASWGTVVGIVTCSFLFSLTLESINDIWGWMMMGFGAGFLVPAFLRLYWWRFNGAGSAVGTLIGIAAAIVQRLLWPDLNEVWQFVFVLTVGFVSSVTVALLTKPTDPQVLRKMYLQTRPFGVWGHLKNMLSPEERERTSQEHRRDLMALPFAMLWQTTLFLAPMLFIIHNWEGFAITSAICLGSFAAIWFLWFRHQPGENFHPSSHEEVIDENR